MLALWSPRAPRAPTPGPDFTRLQRIYCPESFPSELRQPREGLELCCPLEVCLKNITCCF